MSADPRVRQLLDQLLDSDATPEEVCDPCPELLPEVRERWMRMRRLQIDLDAIFPPHGSESHLDEKMLPDVAGYRVEALLGRGGMGVVFRAWHLRLNRPVALKMTLAGAYGGPRERERFRREAEAVAGLGHPNVVQVYDVGEADGRPYYTMELVEGGSLAQTLNGVPWPAERAAELVGTLAAAVQAAHATGIVHRDLKPANVLLTAVGTPKVSDFGLARRLDDEPSLTQTGVAVGTPSYMAPEQAGGIRDTVSPAADVYSLGAILYELLTGRPPFHGETAAETVQQLLTHDPVPPSRLNPRVPRDLETVCLKCLNKSPRQRYATAGELADDIGRFRRGEAITARPDGVVQRWARRVRRRPLLTMAVATATLITVVLAGATLWIVSDRAAAKRMVDADLRELEDDIKRSEWGEARSALGRAKARLGNRRSVELCRRIDRADSDLTLVVRLDAARLASSWSVNGVLAFAQTDVEYEKALREAGLWLPGDEPEMVADRVVASDVREAIVNALDSGSLTSRDPGRKQLFARIARLADPDDWRDRARNPEVWKDPAALTRVAADAPVGDNRVPLFLLLAERCRDAGLNAADLLKRVHHAHPGDFWLNLRLGAYAFYGGRYQEAVRFYQAAVAIRADAGVARDGLGMSLAHSGQIAEGLIELKEALRLDPTAPEAHTHLANVYTGLGRHADAIRHARTALETYPESAMMHEVVAIALEGLGEFSAALEEHRRAVACDVRFEPAQQGLRNFFRREKRFDEMAEVWKASLASRPTDHAAWYGYAELCLYLGRENDYRIARREMLSRFANQTSPVIAERVSRSCLLRAAEGDELKQAVALINRTSNVDRVKYVSFMPHFQFAQGLADFRLGKYERAITAMRGDASRVLGPAPKLVLAMALFKIGQVEDARKELSAAVAGQDWSGVGVQNQDEWIYHVLRREAETLITARQSAK